MLADPRDAFAEHGSVVSALAGLAGLARMVRALADARRPSGRRPRGARTSSSTCCWAWRSLGDGGASASPQPDPDGLRRAASAPPDAGAAVSGCDDRPGRRAAAQRLPPCSGAGHRPARRLQGVAPLRRAPPGLAAPGQLQPDQRGSSRSGARLVPRVIVIVHERRWTGAVERFDAADLDVAADLGTLSIGGNRMSRRALRLPGRGRSARARAPRASCTSRPASRPFVVNNQPVGGGRLSWLFVPRLRADGWFSVDGADAPTGRRRSPTTTTTGAGSAGATTSAGSGVRCCRRAGRPVVVRVHADDRPATAARLSQAPLRLAPRRAGRDVPRRRGAGAPQRPARPRPRLHPAAADAAGARRRGGRRARRRSRSRRDRSGDRSGPSSARSPYARLAQPSELHLDRSVVLSETGGYRPGQRVDRRRGDRLRRHRRRSSCSMAEPRGGRAARAVRWSTLAGEVPGELPASASTRSAPLVVEVDVDGERLRAAGRRAGSRGRDGRSAAARGSDRDLAGRRPRGARRRARAGRGGGGGPDRVRGALDDVRAGARRR